jgi:hypothetical protein
LTNSIIFQDGYCTTNQFLFSQIMPDVSNLQQHSLFQCEKTPRPSVQTGWFFEGISGISNKELPSSKLT